MGLIVGGPTAWKVRTQGPFVVAYHWMDVRDGQGEQPCMVIWPHNKPIGCMPCVLPLARAYQYARRDGYPTAELAEACVRYAAAMGMFATRFDLHKLADVILDGLEELVKMPPREAFERQLQPERPPGPTIGEATFKVGDKVIAEREVSVPESMVIENVKLH